MKHVCRVGWSSHYPSSVIISKFASMNSHFVDIYKYSNISIHPLNFLRNLGNEQKHIANIIDEEVGVIF